MSIYTDRLQREPHESKEVVHEKQNLEQINEKVVQGLARARAVAKGNPELTAIVDQVCQEWSNYMTGFIMMAVGLASFRFRSDQEILAKLIESKDKKEQKKMTDFFSHRYSGLA